MHEENVTKYEDRKTRHPPPYPVQVPERLTTRWQVEERGRSKPV